MNVTIEYDKETRDWAVLWDGQIAGFYSSARAAEDAANDLRLRRAQDAACAAAQNWTLERAEGIPLAEWRRERRRLGYDRLREIPEGDQEIIERGRCECGSALRGEARAMTSGRGFVLFVFCPVCKIGCDM